MEFDPGATKFRRRIKWHSEGVKKLRYIIIALFIITFIFSFCMFWLLPTVTQSDEGAETINSREPYLIKEYHIANGKVNAVLENVIIDTNPNTLRFLNFSLLHFGHNSFHIKIWDGANPDAQQIVYEIEDQNIPEPVGFSSIGEIGLHLNVEPFYYKLSEAKKESTYLSTQGLTLEYNKQEKQLKFQIEIGTIRDGFWGLGEEIHGGKEGFLNPPGEYTLYSSEARDNSKNLGGVYPIILIQIREKEWITYYLETYNKLKVNVELTKEKREKQLKITFTLTGNSLSISQYIKMGSLKSVIAFYHSIIGYSQPPMPWSMGHQYRINSPKSSDDIYYSAAKFDHSYPYKFYLPRESVWIMGEYLEKNTEFNIKSSFTDIKEDVIDGLGLRVILGVNPGMLWVDGEEGHPGYRLFEGGRVIYIDTGDQTQVPFFGRLAQADPIQKDFIYVFPSFLDWDNSIWGELLNQLYAHMPYSGLFHDENEVTIKGGGNTYRGLRSHDVDAHKHNITIRDTEDKTLSLRLAVPPVTAHIPKTAYHIHEDKKYYEEDLHSAYGHLMCRASHQGMSKILDKGTPLVPYISTRSAMSATSKYGIHHFIYLPQLPISATHSMVLDAYSRTLLSIYNHQLFGSYLAAPILTDPRYPQPPFDMTPEANYPLTSSALICDILELATFFPSFITVYLESNMKDQEWKDCMLRVISERYRWIFYMYGEVWKVSKEGGTWFTPLIWKFGEEANEEEWKVMMDGAQREFMVGDSLKIINFFGLDVVNSYFTNENWFDYLNNRKIVNEEKSKYKGNIHEISIPKEERTWNHVVYIRGGSIIPISKISSVLTYEDLLEPNKSSTYLLIFKNGSGNAEGQWRVNIDSSFVVCTFKLIPSIQHAFNLTKNCHFGDANVVDIWLHGIVILSPNNQYFEEGFKVRDEKGDMIMKREKLGVEWKGKGEERGRIQFVFVGGDVNLRLMEDVIMFGGS